MSAASLLALAAALGFSASRVLLRPSLAHFTPFQAAFASMAVTTALTWIAGVLTVPLDSLLTWRVLPFLAGGLIAPGLARLLLFKGVSRIGVARSAVLLALAPIFSVAIAIMALGERPGWPLLVGVGCVALGGALASQRDAGGPPRRRMDLVWPLLAALALAFRDNIARWALMLYPEPMVAAMAATIPSMVLLSGVVLHVPAQPGPRPRSAWVVLLLSGAFEGLAFLTLMRAYAVGHVSVVAPLVNTQPFLTVALTAIFLRGFERVTWRVAIAAPLVLAGIALVTGR